MLEACGRSVRYNRTSTGWQREYASQHSQQLLAFAAPLAKPPTHSRWGQCCRGGPPPPAAAAARRAPAGRNRPPLLPCPAPLLPSCLHPLAASRARSAGQSRAKQAGSGDSRWGQQQSRWHQTDVGAAGQVHIDELNRRHWSRTCQTTDPAEATAPTIAPIQQAVLYDCADEERQSSQVAPGRAALADSQDEPNSYAPSARTSLANQPCSQGECASRLTISFTPQR